MPPISYKKKFFSELFDYSVVISLAVALAVIHQYGQPSHSGFFCEDRSLRYPYHESTITSALNTFISYATPLGTIFLRHFFGDRTKSTKFKSYRETKSIIIGGITVQLATHIIKIFAGRLRPHFIDVCVPDLKLDEMTCGPSFNPNYIDQYSCQGNPDLFPLEPDREHRIKESMLSFPSGHMSIATYGMMTSVLVLQSYPPKPTHVVFLVQIACLLYSIMIGISRIQDNKHFASDVMAGAVLGLIVSILINSRMKPNGGKRRKFSGDELPPQIVVDVPEGDGSINEVESTRELLCRQCGTARRRCIGDDPGAISEDDDNAVSGGKFAETIRHYDRQVTTCEQL